MTLRPFLIAAPETGLELDKEPAWIPEDAFVELENAYIWRNRCKRRMGNTLLGRMAGDLLGLKWEEADILWEDADFTWESSWGIDYPALPIMGLLPWYQHTGPVKETIAFNTKKANLVAFSPAFTDINFYRGGTAFDWHGTETQFFKSLNYQNAFFATNSVPGMNVLQIASITKGAVTTINCAASPILVNDYVFLTAIVPPSSSIPDALIMQNLNDHSFLVSNITPGGFEIPFDSSGLSANPTGGTVILTNRATGSGDGIKWYSNDADNVGWVNFTPPVDGANILTGALLLVAYRGYMIALNTTEAAMNGSGITQRFQQRARWSQQGTAFYSMPTPQFQTADGYAWRSDIPGRGGWVDAPTNEVIRGIEYIRDILIVFFDQTVWQLRFTADPAIPFSWAIMNIEIGAGATFSTIPFDNGIMAVGNRGIIAADGNNVRRVDTIIPYQFLKFLSQTDGLSRIYGKRDYINELAYWTFCDKDAAGGFYTDKSIFPNRVLVYNYRQPSFGIFEDSYTCFGEVTGYTGIVWENASMTWEEADFNWETEELIFNSPQIIAGTPGGYVMLLNQGGRNAETIAISSITKASQALVTTKSPHNLCDGDIIKIVSVNGMTEINNKNSQIKIVSSTSFSCVNIDSTAYSTYTYSGDIIVIPSFSMRTKRLNPFLKEGKSVMLRYVDVYCDYVPKGQITLNVFVDENSGNPVNQTSIDGQYVQTVLPLDQTTTYDLPVDKIWVRFNCSARGQFVQLQATLSSDQMLNDDCNGKDFVLHAMILYLAPSGRLIT